MIGGLALRAACRAARDAAWHLAAVPLGAIMRERCVGCRAWGLVPVCPACLAAWPAAPGGPTPAGTDGIIAGAAYAGPARGAVLALKFQGRPQVAGALVAPLLLAAALPGPDWLLVPVPLARGRRRRRGYNQATVLARAIARAHGHRVADVLRRRDAAGPQSKLGRAARLENLTGVVRCVRRLAGARCILVDDVVTTGATATTCAAALRAAGASAVIVAAATRTPRRGPERSRI